MPSISPQPDVLTISANGTTATGNVLSNDVATSISGALAVATVALGSETGTVGQALATPFGDLTLNVDGSFSFALATGSGAARGLPEGQSTVLPISYTVTGGGVTSAAQQLRITITGVNDAPVVAPIAAMTINEGTTNSLPIIGGISDPDSGGSLSVSAQLASGGALPGWLVFDALTRTFTATPSLSDSGTYSVRVTATDNLGAAASQSFDLRVNNVRTGVVADGYLSSATVFVDVNGDRQVTAGEPITLTGANGRFNLVTELPGALTVVSGTNTDTGLPNLVTLMAPAGSTVINPLTTLLQSLVQAGQSVALAEAAVKTAFGLSTSLDLRNFDILAESPTSPLALAAQKAAAVVANILTRGDALGNGASSDVFEKLVLGRLTDLVATATGPIDLTASATVLPLFASVGSDADKAVLTALGATAVNQMIMASPSFQGIANVQTIAASNKPPTVISETVTLAEDQTATFDPRSNDTDADGGTLRIIAVDGKPITVGTPVTLSHGKLTFQADGRFIFQPDANYNGVSQFIYAAGDGQGGHGSAIVVLHVTAVNDAPVAVADTGFAVTKGAPVTNVTGNVRSNDSDVDTGDFLSVTTPTHVGQAVPGKFGSLSINGVGAFTYTLDANDPDTMTLYSGQTATEVFTYILSDGQISRTTTLTITVNGAGHPFGATTGNDNIVGTAAGDVINALEGDDIIAGGPGADTLTGGSGADRFLYNELTTNADRDIIKDFLPGTDKLAFAASAFSAGFAFSTSVPANGTATFLYDRATGLLRYDADGTGAGAAVEIALLETTPDLQASSIVIA